MPDPTDHDHDHTATSTQDLASLRRRYPDWYIRHASADNPCELGYVADRDGCLLAAPSLARLADRLADAGQPAGAPANPAALMTGRPGWNSGPMPDMTATDLAAAVAPRGWQIAEHGSHLTAEYRLNRLLFLSGQVTRRRGVLITSQDQTIYNLDVRARHEY